MTINRNLKIAVITIGLLILLVFGLPFLVGVYAKSQIKTLVHTINQKSQNYKLTLTRYQRGWFHAQGRLTIEKTGDVNVAIKRIPFYVSHGPVFYYNEHLHTGLATLDFKLFPSVSQVKNFDNLRIGFLGGVEGRIDIKSPALGQLPLKYDQGTLYFSSNHRLSEFDARIVLNDMSFGSAKRGFQLKAQKLNFALRGRRDTNKHWQYEATLILQHFRNQITNMNDTPLFKQGQGLTMKADAIHLVNLQFDPDAIGEHAQHLEAQLKAQRSSQQAATIDKEALIEALLSDIVNHKTQVIVRNWHFKVPQGQFIVDTTLRWPDLPKTHDFSDLTRYAKTETRIQIPHFHYQHTLKQRGNTFQQKLVLNNVHFKAQQTSVTDAHATLTMGQFEYQPSPKINYRIDGLSYEERTQGGEGLASTKHSWAVKKWCGDQCYRALKGHLTLKNYNAHAETQLREAVGSIIRSNLAFNQTHTDADVYLKQLPKAFNAQTVLQLQLNGITSKGPFAIQGEAKWPKLPQDADYQTWQRYAQYQFTLAYPKAYVKAWVQGILREAKAQQGGQTKHNTSADHQKLDFAKTLRNKINNRTLPTKNGTYIIQLKGEQGELSINE